MSKIKSLVIILLIVCLCSACGNTASNPNAVTESQNLVQVSVPENASEIITDFFVEVNLEEEMPVISIYDYSFDTAAAFLTYEYVIVYALEYIEDCKIFIYTDEEVVETSLHENGVAKGPEDMKLPPKYYTFCQKKNIVGANMLDIFQYVDDATEKLILKNVQTYVRDVLAEHYGESLAEENSEAESLATEAESSENEITKEIIKFEEYETEQVEISMIFSEDSENEYHLSVYISTEVEWKLAYSYIMYNNLLAIEMLEGFNPVLIAICEDVTLTSLGVSMEGTKVIDTGEWCAEHIVSDDFDSEVAAALSDELKNLLLDFLELTE